MKIAHREVGGATRIEAEAAWHPLALRQPRSARKPGRGRSRHAELPHAAAGSVQLWARHRSCRQRHRSVDPSGQSESEGPAERCLGLLVRAAAIPLGLQLRLCLRWRHQRRCRWRGRRQREIKIAPLLALCALLFLCVRIVQAQLSAARVADHFLATCARALLAARLLWTGSSACAAQRWCCGRRPQQLGAEG